MRGQEQVLASLVCPKAGDTAIEQMLDMSGDEVLAQLAGWLDGVKTLNPDLNLVTETPTKGDTHLMGAFSHEGGSRTVCFNLIAGDLLAGCSTQDDLEALVEAHDADVMVAAVMSSREDPVHLDAEDRLIAAAGSPAPRWIVMESGWLAAAVVLRAKPFVHNRVRDDNQGVEPYFTEHSSDATPALRRVSGSTRRSLDAVRLEPRSLPEKVRELSLRADVPGVDTTVVTTFLPPETHSPAALTRYYARGRDVEMASRLIAARQAAERGVWEKHVSDQDALLILDRQQIEEYFEWPEYYQMRLTPDELDEQVGNFSSMLQYERFSVAFCPEAVDIPFSITGDVVEIRGDRRNKSEPRPGRVNGMSISDATVVDELRREAGSLLQATEPQFRDKTFILWWMEWLAGNYRRTWERSRQ